MRQQWRMFFVSKQTQSPMRIRQMELSGMKWRFLTNSNCWQRVKCIEYYENIESHEFTDVAQHNEVASTDDSCVVV